MEDNERAVRVAEFLSLCEGTGGMLPIERTMMEAVILTLRSYGELQASSEVLKGAADRLLVEKVDALRKAEELLGQAAGYEHFIDAIAEAAGLDADAPRQAETLKAVTELRTEAAGLRTLNAGLEVELKEWRKLYKETLQEVNRLRPVLGKAGAPGRTQRQVISTTIRRLEERDKLLNGDRFKELRGQLEKARQEVTSANERAAAVREALGATYGEASHVAAMRVAKERDALREEVRAADEVLVRQSIPLPGRVWPRGLQPHRKETLAEAAKRHHRTACEVVARADKRAQKAGELVADLAEIFGTREPIRKAARKVMARLQRTERALSAVRVDRNRLIEAERARMELLSIDPHGAAHKATKGDYTGYCLKLADLTIKDKDATNLFLFDELVIQWLTTWAKVADHRERLEDMEKIREAARKGPVTMAMTMEEIERRQVERVKASPTGRLEDVRSIKHPTERERQTLECFAKLRNPWHFIAEGRGLSGADFAEAELRTLAGAGFAIPSEAQLRMALRTALAVGMFEALGIKLDPEAVEALRKELQKELDSESKAK